MMIEKNITVSLSRFAAGKPRVTAANFRFWFLKCFAPVSQHIRGQCINGEPPGIVSKGLQVSYHSKTF